MKKIQRYILKGKEKFQKRKWAYFSPNVRGKGVSKPLFFFSSSPFGPKFVGFKIISVYYVFVWFSRSNAKLLLGFQLYIPE
jgi:hypothetical protein